jgi:hypothetical protein
LFGRGRQLCPLQRVYMLQPHFVWLRYDVMPSNTVVRLRAGVCNPKVFCPSGRFLLERRFWPTRSLHGTVGSGCARATLVVAPLRCTILHHGNAKTGSALLKGLGRMA